MWSKFLWSDKSNGYHGNSRFKKSVATVYFNDIFWPFGFEIFSYYFRILKLFTSLIPINRDRLCTFLGVILDYRCPSSSLLNSMSRRRKLKWVAVELDKTVRSFWLRSLLSYFWNPLRLFTIIDIFVTISMIDIEFERLTHAETNQNLYWNRLADQLNYTWVTESSSLFQIYESY